MTTYALNHPQWGWLTIAPYPSLWLDDKTKAHHFASLASAMRARKRWDKSIAITVVAVTA